MPDPVTLEAFIAMVESGEHVKAIEQFYAEDATMQENHRAPRVGRNTLMANESKALSRIRSVDSQCIRPVFVNGENVVIRWVFVFTGKDGKQSRMEELACQRWAGGRIREEKFFYDPAQMQA